MKQEDRLRENILLLRSRMKLTVPQFAKAIGIPEGTFRDHYRVPSNFRMGEIWILERLGDQYGIDIRGGGEKRAAG